jgi:cell division septal protein FtsQ
VSDKHANFIQCDPGGSAADVADLMAEVRERVREELGIDLRSEVRLAGFDDDTALDAGAQPAGVFDVTTNATRTLTALDKVFGPLPGDDTLGAVTIAPPLPDEAVAELRELFADTGAVERPAATPAAERGATADAPPADTPVADVVDISARLAAPRGESGDRTPPRVVIDDADHLLPHERPAGSAAMTLDPASPFAEPSTAVTGVLADVIVDDRIARSGRRLFPRIRVSPLVGFGTVLAVAALTLVVLASPLFGVREIEVTGNTYTDPALLASVTDSLRGVSVFTVDVDGAQRRLAGDPWVKRARVRWYFPNRVVVEIDERVPVAWFVGVDNRARVLDFEGRVLDVLDGQPTQFLKIEGVGPNLATGTVPTQVYQAAAQLATSLPTNLERLVEHVTVNGPEALGMVLKTGTVINLGAPVDVRNKLTIVESVLIRQDPKFVKSIDVANGQPVVASD